MLSPKMMEIPITKVLRASIMRDMMICRPARIKWLTAKISEAPMIGVGMMTKIEANLGKKASTIDDPGAVGDAAAGCAQAMESPILPDETDCPRAPSIPDRMLLIPQARTPPLMLTMSGRFHWTSLIFWQVVTSPMVLRADERAATRKGAKRTHSKDNP